MINITKYYKPMEILYSIPEDSIIEFTYDLMYFHEEQIRNIRSLINGIKQIC